MSCYNTDFKRLISIHLFLPFNPIPLIFFLEAKVLNREKVVSNRRDITKGAITNPRQITPRQAITRHDKP